VEIFRLLLFLGLVLHKLLWEVLKRGARVSKVRRASSDRSYVWLVRSVKVMILIFLGFQTLFLDLFPITDRPTILRVIGTVIYLVGLATAVTGRLHLGTNWTDLEDYQVSLKRSLVTTGIYRYIRHPIYIGDVLLLIGLQLALNSWLVLATSIPLLVIIRQALAEEALLSQTCLGYQAYRSQTKRFIPFIL
jgi:protein-S-isoprenylcysteine O-methyltransferase Ste14